MPEHDEDLRARDVAVRPELTKPCMQDARLRAGGYLAEAATLPMSRDKIGLKLYCAIACELKTPPATST